MFAIVNCDIFTGASVLHDRAVVVDGDRVAAIVPEEGLAAGLDRINLQGQCLAPGFIDTQVNGGGGVLFNDTPTPEGIRAIAAAHRRFGTTDLLPTFITDAGDQMAAAAAAVRDVRAEAPFGGVLGIHFEGPFLAESKAGVHDKRFIRPPNDSDFSTIESMRGTGAVVVTLAPEVCATEDIRRLRRSGALVSIGHTNATCEQAAAAFRAGATCATHVFNAMSALTSRSPGVVGAALDDRASWMGIIVDGHHSDFVAARVAIRAKARGKTFLVTDAMPPVGATTGDFRLGEYAIEVKDGRCVTPDGVLAGSALDMATAVRNCVQQLGIPLDEALRMASTYAAEFLGLGDKLGRIAPGYRANFAVFNNQVSVSAVFMNGRYEILA